MSLSLRVPQAFRLPCFCDSDSCRVVLPSVPSCKPMRHDDACFSDLDCSDCFSGCAVVASSMVHVKSCYLCRQSSAKLCVSSFTSLTSLDANSNSFFFSEGFSDASLRRLRSLFLSDPSQCVRRSTFAATFLDANFFLKASVSSVMHRCESATAAFTLPFGVRTLLSALGVRPPFHVCRHFLDANLNVKASAMHRCDGCTLPNIPFCDLLGCSAMHCCVQPLQPSLIPFALFAAFPPPAPTFCFLCQHVAAFPTPVSCFSTLSLRSCLSVLNSSLS